MLVLISVPFQLSLTNHCDEVTSLAEIIVEAVDNKTLFGHIILELRCYEIKLRCANYVVLVINCRRDEFLKHANVIVNRSQEFKLASLLTTLY